MRIRPKLLLALVVVVVVGFVGACSGSDAKPLTPDEAVASLMSQGYSEAGAQCVIEEVQRQNVDIFMFLAKAKVSDRELEVMSTVGAFCARQFGLGGTTVPPTIANG